MKKLLIGLLLVSSSAFAHQHGYWHPGGYNRWNWVTPAIIGGVVTYELTRPPVVVQQPVIVQQPVAPYGYHYENILDANCNCYRLVLVQN